MKTSPAFHAWRNRHKRQRAQWLKDNPVIGQWTLLSLGPVKNHQSTVNCRCSCGVEKAVWLHALKTGRTTRCKQCYHDSKKKVKK
jgi:hypothetical protein